MCNGQMKHMNAKINLLIHGGLLTKPSPLENPNSNKLLGLAFRINQGPNRTKEYSNDCTITERKSKIL